MELKLSTNVYISSYLYRLLIVPYGIETSEGEGEETGEESF